MDKDSSHQIAIDTAGKMLSKNIMECMDGAKIALKRFPIIVIIVLY